MKNLIVEGMKFWNICKGKFAQQVQQEFEEAQIKALNCGDTVKLTINIKITPPDDVDGIGDIEYDYKSTNPVMKSRSYSTQFEGNAIVADDTDIASLLQYKMDLGEEEINGQ